MDREDAARHLGVDGGAPPDEVRSAFRRLLLRHHPDLAGGDGATTRTLTEAYRTLLRAEPTPEPPDAGIVTARTDDTLTLAVPPDEAFLRLLDAASRFGEVTYVDAEAGLLEVVVTFDDGRTASLVVTLQGRAATGTTDAFCTLEPLGREPAPPVSVVVDVLVSTLG